MNPLQKQEGGSHYKDCKIQPVEYIHANGLGYIEGAVIKYVTRYKAKNGAEDIKKAIHFLELLLQLEYSANAAAHKAPSLCDSEGKQAVAYPFTFPPALKWMGRHWNTHALHIDSTLQEAYDLLSSPRDHVAKMFTLIRIAEAAIRDQSAEEPSLDLAAIAREVCSV